ncbi:hypothetical protein [Veronia pacifica]|uniref:hypothetical protein n=1 Tax=Veronia pacifica TaxID=1080227 RepID=UPI001585E59D|nr:hypothetical protein [Veronia pacifica]
MVSTQVVSPECFVVEPNNIYQVLKEPDFFNVDDYRRIIQVATGKLSELTGMASQR